MVVRRIWICHSRIKLMANHAKGRLKQLHCKSGAKNSTLTVAAALAPLLRTQYSFYIYVLCSELAVCCLFCSSCLLTISLVTTIWLAYCLRGAYPTFAVPFRTTFWDSGRRLFPNLCLVSRVFLLVSGQQPLSRYHLDEIFWKRTASRVSLYIPNTKYLVRFSSKKLAPCVTKLSVDRSKSTQNQIILSLPERDTTVV